VERLASVWSSGMGPFVVVLMAFSVGSAEALKLAFGSGRPIANDVLLGVCMEPMCK